MAFSMANQTQPIIKKVKKVSGGGHHGGAWKVAYADFVTAMMAFFLLMWLLNATSEEQKRGISNYFGPVGMSTAASGSGGVLGGTSVATDGSFVDSKASPAVTMLMPQTNAGEAKTEGDEKDQKEAGSANVPTKSEATQTASATVTAKDESKEATQPAQELPVKSAEAVALDKKNFADAEERIRQAIMKSPELKQFAENLIIDMTPEGLRIQIVDQDRKAMFPSGEKKMYDHTVKLLTQIAAVIKTMPNKISITGHTDSNPYQSGGAYSNWELSADRANASRKVLGDAGLKEERINHVTGKAANEPLDAADPAAPKNRRISIVLLNTEMVPRDEKASKS